MEQLNEERLKIAETQLKDLFPQSMQVYGYIFQKNRAKDDQVHVLVDRWPDFNVVICQPVNQGESHFIEMCVFTKDEAILRNILEETNMIEWSNFFCLGTSLCHGEVVVAAAWERKVAGNKVAVCHMMTLQDPSRLPPVDSIIESKISSLDETHADLVNKTWKFGMSESSLGKIRNMIRHYPSCCVLNAENQQPIAWILTYPSCAIGMLYTLPEHRGKGLARALVNSMSRRLYAEGFPVYCFIEEGNTMSHSLFTSLGFTEDPQYREAWFNFNSL
ncbi:glycine N-acyltransferase-like protein 3 [Esox lucius]|uniref:Glycine N-acyltransferase-like protein n=1 Tax=Esox lucius TaxID=8010 RepID=A0A3P8ZZZ0_ESOLU|nr:glycine N-acyltransferase-like protein 3 [Esox lucius]XP_010867722.1 glycine N-acyltransferase-like protein 3 [Esox lucius]XP_010867726.1 glycine N-acyltransferase-like protein 3 [Esox lucius]